MESSNSPRNSRNKKLPLWLSECVRDNHSDGVVTEDESDLLEEDSCTDIDFSYHPKRLRSALKLDRREGLGDGENLSCTVSQERFSQPVGPLLCATRYLHPEHLEPAGLETEGKFLSDDNTFEASQAARSTPEPPSLILEIPQDLLAKILSFLPINILLQTSAVCKAFASASEAVFEGHCKQKRWRQPRRPRGEQAEVRLFPWRSLFRQHACQGCGKGGEFLVRVDFSGPLAFRVCRRCAMDHRERLAYEGLYIDLVGISGKRLITNNKRNRYVFGSRRGRMREVTS